MTVLLSLLNVPTAHTLAWALMHFLWQGTLLAIAAAAVMRWVASSADSRYLVGVITLAAMLAAPVTTFVWLRSVAPADVVATVNDVGPADTTAPHLRNGAAIGNIGSPAVSRTMRTLLPIVVVIWLSGVLMLSVRLLGGWIVARRLAITSGRPVAMHVRDLAARVAERLHLRRLVRIAESSAVTVPIVVGWLKPVVLLPAAALAGLSPAHLEALLAHELAHVRRQDYLVNLLQSVVETLLFYHPGMWWVSGRVRIEREHCCDDLAVTVCDRFVYVDALTDLAARTARPRLALAATDGPLLRRVRRLLEHRANERAAEGWLSVGAMILLAAALAPTVLALGGDDGPTTVAPRVTMASAFAVPADDASAAVRPAVPASDVATTVERRTGVVDITAPRPLVTLAAVAEPVVLSPKPSQEAGTVELQRDLAVVTELRQSLADKLVNLVAASPRPRSQREELTIEFFEIKLQHVETHRKDLARRLFETRASTTGAAADFSARIRVGDTLLIQASGDSPSSHAVVVDASGAVTLPLIGRLSVVDLTTSQVQEAMTKALANQTPAVVLRRPN